MHRLYSCAVCVYEDLYFPLVLYKPCDHGLWNLILIDPLSVFKLNAKMFFPFSFFFLEELTSVIINANSSGSAAIKVCFKGWIAKKKKHNSHLHFFRFLYSSVRKWCQFVLLHSNPFKAFCSSEFRSFQQIRRAHFYRGVPRSKQRY